MACLPEPVAAHRSAHDPAGDSIKSLAARSLLLGAMSLLGGTRTEENAADGDAERCEEAAAGISSEAATEEGATAGSAGWALLRCAFSIGKIRPGGRRTHEVDDAENLESALDMADVMERGLSREVAMEFLEPLPKSRKLWRFHVIRSPKDFRLFSAEGVFLMCALVAVEEKKIEFFFEVPKSNGQRGTSIRPVFTMNFDERKTDWRLVHERCEHCQYAPPHLSCSQMGKQQIAFIRHTHEAIDHGLWNCMDLHIPGLYSNRQRVVWCPKLGLGDLADPPFDRHKAHCLTTIKPSWHEEVESLVLDFVGRDIVSSAKNFQLQLQQKPGHIICQYGKMGSSTFALDCRYPLSLVQAFAAAMTTVFWT
mmetsp:Transcript_160184/g.292523  ORF Transcript_160184/g.292523 Transcript_160184/m.292523 type:complete len:366 (-) Transcript_160184:38-1135(-)